MKKRGVLHHRVSEVIASMGHGDLMVVADAGLPIPSSVERIDLAVTPGLPGLVDVVRAIGLELEVEAIVVATELLDGNVSLAQEITNLFPGSEVRTMAHEEFKSATHSAMAVVRTGECTPYANVILISGVPF